MVIPSEPFNDCDCCGYGFNFLGRINIVDDEVYLWGTSSGNLAYDTYQQSDLADIINNRVVTEALVMCDEQNRYYTIATGDAATVGNFLIMRRRKADSDILDWVYEDQDLVVSNAFGVTPQSASLSHYDVGSDFGSYFCGHSDTPITGSGTASDLYAVLRKLNSDGVSEFLKLIWNDLGGDRTNYHFLSCASDTNGNSVAVGYRSRLVGASLDKFDYIIYYFDADGNEVWHDEIADDATDNADNFGLVGHQVAFDSLGNVYVGFSALEPGTWPFLRKYNSSGTVVWTKTVASTGSGIGSYALATTTDKVIIVFRPASTVGGQSGFFIRQYTLAGSQDWESGFGSTTVSGDGTVDKDGNIYVSHLEGHIRKISKVDGSQLTARVGTLTLSQRVFTKPGRHPHFI